MAEMENEVNRKATVREYLSYLKEQRRLAAENRKKEKEAKNDETSKRPYWSFRNRPIYE